MEKSLRLLSTIALKRSSVEQGFRFLPLQSCKGGLLAFDASVYVFCEPVEGIWHVPCGILQGYSRSTGCQVDFKSCTVLVPKQELFLPLGTKCSLDHQNCFFLKSLVLFVRIGSQCADKEGRVSTLLYADTMVLLASFLVDDLKPVLVLRSVTWLGWELSPLPLDPWFTIRNGRNTLSGCDVSLCHLACLTTRCLLLSDDWLERWLKGTELNLSVERVAWGEMLIACGFCAPASPLFLLSL